MDLYFTWYNWILFPKNRVDNCREFFYFISVERQFLAPSDKMAD
jgi:hypothetical protein